MGNIMENLEATRTIPTIKANFNIIQEKPGSLTKNGEEIDREFFESLHEIKDERPLSSGESLEYSKLCYEYYPIHWENQIIEDEKRLLQRKCELVASAEYDNEITKTFGYENELHNIKTV